MYYLTMSKINSEISEKSQKELLEKNFIFLKRI